MKDRLEFLKTFNFRSFKSRFFYFLDMTFEETEKEMKKFVESFGSVKSLMLLCCWSASVSDILYVGAASKVLEKSLDVGHFDNVIGVYTWFPYRDLENCYDLREWTIYPKNFRFPNKLKINLNNSQIIICCSCDRASLI